MSNVSDRYSRIAATFSGRVSVVPPDRWTSPSPCPGWTALDVVRHVVESHYAFPGLAGLSLPAGPSVDDAPVLAWAHARDAMQELLEDPERVGAEYDGRGGRSTVGQAVGSFLCFDLIVHGWDLARATGTDEAIPVTEIDDAFAFAERMGDNLRLPGVCGPAVEAPPDADRQTLLLALLGRTA